MKKLIIIVILLLINILVTKRMKKNKYIVQTYYGKVDNKPTDNSPSITTKNGVQYTPVNNGLVSQNGVVKSTTQTDIPYGTGYSYGPSQKIKFD